jgi:hypothetical protein
VDIDVKVMEIQTAIVDIRSEAHEIHASVISSSYPNILPPFHIPPQSHIPPPSRIFQGRQTILDKMNQFFMQDIGKQHIYVLHGLGGAGKTQIGLEFINNSSQ